jgi:flagellar basal-body rod protein FlgB
VDPIHLFDLAGRQARWLSTDQSVIAANVANASTPGYRAKAVQPFSEVFDKTQLQMASTSPSHLALDPMQAQAAAIKEENPWEVTESGNSVSLEQELIKAGDVNRAYSLNTGIVKSFHSMLMSAVKA